MIMIVMIATCGCAAKPMTKPEIDELLRHKMVICYWDGKFEYCEKEKRNEQTK